MDAHARHAESMLLLQRMNASMSAYEATITDHLESAMATQTRLEHHLESAFVALNRMEDQLAGALQTVQQIYLLLYSDMAGIAVCVALQLALVVLWLRRKRPDPTFVFV
jgi:hypothetical protein